LNSPASLRDPYWAAAWEAVAPLLTPQDLIVLPPGDWPAAPCETLIYHDRIELRGATVLLLHKGKIGGISKGLLRHVMLSWRCVHANEVFVCLFKNRAAVTTPQGPFRHLGSIRQNFRSRALKRIRPTVFLVHLPKSAGTSLWNFLADRVPSCIYYDRLENFLANPPKRGEYDLVGGHVPLRLMAPCIGPEDHVACVMREPTARFRSAFLHARRAQEDPATFTPVMRQLRELPLAQFLATPDGQMELRQQFLMLGHDLITDYDPSQDQDITRNAAAWVQDPRSLMGTVEHLDDFLTKLLALLGIADPGALLPVTNSSGPPPPGALEEFESQRAAIESGNAPERALYDLVGRFA
jgi:hypothetical protein